MFDMMSIQVVCDIHSQAARLRQNETQFFSLQNLIVNSRVILKAFRLRIHFQTITILFDVD